MADTKLSELTELAATPADDDEVYIRDVSEEEPGAESKRITVTNLMAAGKSIVTGSYVGNDTARQITTGFKCSMVIIQSTDCGDYTDSTWILIPSITILHWNSGGATDHQDKTAEAWLHATDGFSTSQYKPNRNGSTYYYWAISE